MKRAENLNGRIAEPEKSGLFMQIVNAVDILHKMYSLTPC